MEGCVFNVQKYSVHDGPGIRTIVFLKGCPLHCKWCCNPESQLAKPQIAYNPEKCIGDVCMLCAQVCPQKNMSLLDTNKVWLITKIVFIVLHVQKLVLQKQSVYMGNITMPSILLIK